MSALPCAPAFATRHGQPDENSARKTRRARPAAPPTDGCANQQSPLVRVCLLRYADAAQITLEASSGAKLLGMGGKERAAGFGPWTFAAHSGSIGVRDARGRALGTVETGKAWRVQVEEPNSVLAIRSGEGKRRHYRGSLEIRNAGGEIRLVNEVDMDSYLGGVVISEIGDGPLEAIKAQAVAARTYAISSRGRWKADGYDLRDTVDSQAYNGVEAETEEGNQAVQETSGWILTQNGQPIDADFYDDCGGVTAPGDDPNILPRSVSDAEAHRYIRHSPHGVWSLTLSPARLAALVGRNSKARGKGTLQNVEIVSRDVSGRAQRVRLAWGANPEAAPPLAPRPSAEGRVPNVEAAGGKAQDASLPGQNQFHPPSDAPTIPPLPLMTTEVNGETLRGLIGYDVLRSTLFAVKRLPSGDFQFDGKGWGHGHGLCQQGALALAAPPLNRSYAAILLHYYPGARLSRMSQAEEAGEPGKETKNREQAHGG